MQVGTLVKLVYWRADVIWIGVIVDTHSGNQRIHRVAFIDSDIEWCSEDDLEVLCK